MSIDEAREAVDNAVMEAVTDGYDILGPLEKAVDNLIAAVREDERQKREAE